jgi:hypothetical protein
VLAASITALAVAACANDDRPTGLGTKSLTIGTDTIPGTGQLAELQQRRAAWVARGITDYRVQVEKSCFCVSDITRPVLIEVRGGAVSKVWDLETAQPVSNTSLYPTITGLFDAAIAERSRGGNVSVSYDASLGTPARLEIGTVANDAGVQYFLSGIMRI